MLIKLLLLYRSTKYCSEYPVNNSVGLKNNPLNQLLSILMAFNQVDQCSGHHVFYVSVNQLGLTVQVNNDFNSLYILLINQLILVSILFNHVDQCSSSHVF